MNLLTGASLLAMAKSIYYINKNNKQMCLCLCISSKKIKEKWTVIWLGKEENDKKPSLKMFQHRGLLREQSHVNWFAKCGS